MSNTKSTININADLHRMLKIEAAKSGLKISELAESLLKDGLNERLQKNKH